MKVRAILATVAVAFLVLLLVAIRSASRAPVTFAFQTFATNDAVPMACFVVSNTFRSEKYALFGTSGSNGPNAKLNRLNFHDDWIMLRPGQSTSACVMIPTGATWYAVARISPTMDSFPAKLNVLLRERFGSGVLEHFYSEEVRAPGTISSNVTFR